MFESLRYGKSYFAVVVVVVVVIVFYVFYVVVVVVVPFLSPHLGWVRLCFTCVSFFFQQMLKLLFS